MQTPISFLRLGHRDRSKLLDPPCAVDPGGFVERGVDLRHSREQQHRAKAKEYPDPDDPDRREGRVEVAEPGPGDVAQSDRGQALVDQAAERQQPAPDDAGGHERDDLGQEQDRPRDGPEGATGDPVDDARRDEPERDRDQAEEQHEAECVEERLA